MNVQCGSAGSPIKGIEPAPRRNALRPRHAAIDLPAASLAGFLLAFLAFAGCITQPPDPKTAEEDRLGPSPYEVIGYVSLVDADRDLAVVTLESHVRGISGDLTSRNEILIETATLETSGQHSGRSLGVRILSGLPNIGDEVIIKRN